MSQPSVLERLEIIASSYDSPAGNPALSRELRAAITALQAATTRIAELERITITLTEDLRVETATRKIIAADNKEVHAKLARYENQPTIAYVDKDQPNSIAWCPTYPDSIKDITPLIAKASEPQGETP